MARRQGILGVAFGFGFSIGPALGGMLSSPATWGWTDAFTGTIFETFPYLLPCLASSALSLTGFILATNLLKESHPREMRTISAKRSAFGMLGRNFSDMNRMLKRPALSPLLWSFTLYWVGLTIMHATFILFTMRTVSVGGLGFDESDNGWVFAFIGLCGIITQGWLIGPLTDRFNSSRLMAWGFVISGLGLVAIPFASPQYALVTIMLITAMISIGNGLIQPSNMTLLTHVSGPDERGIVMGVSESLRAIASFIGVLIGGWVWDLTNKRTDVLDFHTVFQISGIFAFLGWACFRFSTSWGIEQQLLRTGESE